jgi:hypothetical protein
MNSEDKKLTAEQWLDDALAHYSAAEPRAGLESRILANLEAHVWQRRRRWVLAVAASAAVVVFAMLIANVRGSRQDIPNNVARQAPPSEIKSIDATPAVSARRQGANARISHSSRLIAHNNLTVLQAANIKQAHFQVTRPLSDQGAERPPTPSIKISDLKTIQAIEVRELTPIKEID